MQADLVFHASMCGVGLLQLTAGLLLLLSPDPSDAPFHMLLSLAPLTVSMVASSATLRLWRQTPPNRVPTHGEALLALASSLPLMGVTLIGVLGGAWTAYARGDARPLAAAVTVLFAQHLYRLVFAWVTYCSRRHLPKSRAHTRSRRR
ncbi:hypothetical protein [Deinococcus multiflagellatus]|uniref:hypothetical protein n=1 Tax=Deinococcus multiflagellatus TaxID=1656887 RepID=UPI001CCF08CE|nr:hypothetical protein [Deinococcus multiflagellatus]MBZ9715784.1 hypothetical protein [Deinococcus multiflagellatus]